LVSGGKVPALIWAFAPVATAVKANAATPIIQFFT
jgi:hypothetical protein